MSLLTKQLFSNFWSKHISLYKFIRHEITFTSAQYYTFENNVSNRQSEVFKPKSLKVCKIFTLPSIKHNWSNLSSKFREVLTITFTSQKPKHLGYLWYSSLEVISIKEFFTLLEMPDTFYSRFKIMELHVWMLLYHLPQTTRFHKLVRYGLIQAMWDDTENRAKITEKYNLNFRKNMKTLYQKFKLSLFLYDEGFYGDDMALTSALWFSFFDQSNVDPRILEVLVSYVRHQMNRLNELNMEVEEVSKKDRIRFPVEPLEPHVKKVFNRT